VGWVGRSGRRPAPRLIVRRQNEMFPATQMRRANGFPTCYRGGIQSRHAACSLGEPNGTQQNLHLSAIRARVVSGRRWVAHTRPVRLVTG
jgi:hypothetical protein